ncbi:hypothetical protein KUL42_22770 [Alteromonas sp. KUL42]|uniref:sodium:solute symporter family transporter n=1 Tax=Alteromonas sp. KUL42 TaxID=2480797 RepID=UPI0010FFBFAF|nr:hypothetical protein [Alteromonas sp. KUL42]GEA07516.1 hypothetical protein KUL42_22770 [Alteromonas sp. KUL42]
MALEHIVFLLTLLPIPILVYLAKRNTDVRDEFGGKTYGRFAVGISAAATGNSGFIMTGAVGLGYAYGLQWILLPLSWLIGDLIFWKYGPKKLNGYCSKNNLSNVVEVISGKGGKPSSYLFIFTLIFVITLLSAYISSQWLAGAKIITGFVDIEPELAIVLFGGFVSAYCIVGKYRGSVYTDLYQGLLMLIVTTLSLYLVFSLDNTIQTGLDDSFYSITGSMSAISVLVFVFGYLTASIGFGFGQLQVTSRYISAKDPVEAENARWIYILFLQYTWIGMTLFGVILRQKSFQVIDPEAALIPFFHENAGAILTGVAVAGIFAAIASTVDSIIISITNLIKSKSTSFIKSHKFVEPLTIFSIAIVTVGFSIQSNSSVFSIALISISMIGGVLAGPIIIRLYDFKHTDWSLFISIVTSCIGCIMWRVNGLSSIINEAVIGIGLSFVANYFAYLSIATKNENQGPKGEVEKG